MILLNQIPPLTTTKNYCPGFALDFHFNKDSKIYGVNVKKVKPTESLSFRARAAYQLRNVSNFDYRITYEQPANGHILCKPLRPDYCQIYYYCCQFNCACTVVRNFWCRAIFRFTTLLSNVLHCFQFYCGVV